MTTAMQKRPTPTNDEHAPQSIAEFVRCHGQPQQQGDRFLFPDGASLEISDDGLPIFIEPPTLDAVTARIEEVARERAAAAAREAEARRMEAISRPEHFIDQEQRFLRDRQNIDHVDDGRGRVWFEDGSVHVNGNVFASQGPPVDVIERTARIRQYRQLKVRQAKGRMDRIRADLNPRAFRDANRQLAQAEAAFREVDVLHDTLCTINTSSVPQAERDALIQRRLVGQPITLEFYEGPDHLVTSRLCAAKPWA